MSNFTPGPWKCHEQYGEYAICVPLGVEHPEGKPIARAYYSEADARLIAAAPEMAKLLSEAWLLMDDALTTQISDPEKGEDMSILCEKIDALLNKINGGEITE
jgi:hypothetical protein